MDAVELFQRLALALAIGLLIGVERGWKERELAEGRRVAGIRTFALIGLLGAFWRLSARRSVRSCRRWGLPPSPGPSSCSGCAGSVRPSSMA
ncbi:MgtC/SapB family protein [Kaustia mangrovi]|uniref:MgtC/SapB family protein n=1 Tax=Kaustia mangrovi TaxID=2593653 RepID=A0A7S8C0Z3_9HYPH|nr:MgtC/SapB family protein [Kaustia mangrovi]QPC41372.1 MgtC/SapB family protein [Kaustia mangrovi]